MTTQATGAAASQPAAAGDDRLAGQHTAQAAQDPDAGPGSAVPGPPAAMNPAISRVRAGAIGGRSRAELTQGTGRRCAKDAGGCGEVTGGKPNALAAGRWHHDGVLAVRGRQETAAGSCSAVAGLADVYERHFVEIHRYVAGRLGRDIADDIAADAFVIALRKYSGFDAGRGSLRVARSTWSAVCASWGPVAGYATAASALPLELRRGVHRLSVPVIAIPRPF
jgi:hypothetical protein